MDVWLSFARSLVMAAGFFGGWLLLGYLMQRRANRGR